MIESAIRAPRPPGPHSRAIRRARGTCGAPLSGPTPAASPRERNEPQDERDVGSAAGAWLRMQSAYDLAQAQKYADQIDVKQLAAARSWLREPYSRRHSSGASRGKPQPSRPWVAGSPVSHS